SRHPGVETRLKTTKTGVSSHILRQNPGFSTCCVWSYKTSEIKTRQVFPDKDLCERLVIANFNLSDQVIPRVVRGVAASTVSHLGRHNYFSVAGLRWHLLYHGVFKRRLFVIRRIDRVAVL